MAIIIISALALVITAAVVGDCYGEVCRRRDRREWKAIRAARAAQ